MRTTKFLLFILLIFLLTSSFVFAAKPFPDYKPYHPLVNGPENITSVCGKDISSCNSCTRNYRQDCGYYYAKNPSDCSAFTDSVDKFICINLVYTSKIRDPNKIREVCEAVGNEEKRTDSRYWCLLVMVPQYGSDPKVCLDIPRTKTFVDLVDVCLTDYAVNNKDAEVCGDTILGPYSALSCCLRAKYPDISGQYVPTRPDLVEDFLKKHKTEYDDCLAITKVKEPAVIEKCEDINCACLDPCNRLSDKPEAQSNCSRDCAEKYLMCYGEEKTLMTAEKRQMYDMQSFYGQFSRKHCRGHSFLPDSAGDTLDTEITGKITDFDNKAMPYLLVEVGIGTNTFRGMTNEQGKYNISVKGVKLPAGKTEIEGNVTATMSYFRNGKNYYNIWYGNPMAVLAYTKKFKLMNAPDTVIDLMIDGHASADESVNRGQIAWMKHFSVIYTYTSDVTDFALAKLKANIDYKLPVDVVTYSGSGTAYSRDTSSINIKTTDSNYDSTNKPDNREYHEFCHHILFSQWNGQGLRGPGDANHDGYINNKTGDSYTEGFAEFCAMATSKYKSDPNPDIYAGFGSLEKNYKAWSHQGYDEELAVAGILWDLYDDKGDTGDSVSIPLEELWPVLKVRRENFYEYYKALRLAFPDKADGIDKIFIAHGFFADNHTGNKIRDPEEPYKDSNANDAYDAGEPFIDYGQIEGLTHPWMQYEPGYVVGKATNYERPSRGSIVKLPGAYVKATEPKVARYKVSVHMKNPADGDDFEYYTSAEEGLVYVAPLPEELGAEIIVAPDSKEYTSGAAYKITNKEYLQKFYSAPDSQGYFDSYDFMVKPTGVKEDKPDIPPSGGDMQSSEATKESEAGNSGIAPNTLLGIAGIGVIGLGMLIFGAIFLAVLFLVLKKKK